jgi:hypothetical protein
MSYGAEGIAAAVSYLFIDLCHMVLIKHVQK